MNAPERVFAGDIEYVRADSITDILKPGRGGHAQDENMKPIYKLGTFKRPNGTTVNVWKMKRGAWDVYAYRPQGKTPVVIPLDELRTWTKTDP